MKRIDPRINTDPEAAPLAHSPFAALNSEGLPQQNPAPPVLAEIIEEDTAPDPTLSFSIEKTRKGGYPIFVEKRGGNKQVTIIRNLSGDLKSLLATLRKHCSAGGVVRRDALELQGDHRTRVEEFLKNHPH